MKLPDTEIEKACTVKGNRAYLNQPWLDVKNRKLVASDGHIMAVHDVKPTNDDTIGPITIEAIKTARKLKRTNHNTLQTLPDALTMLGAKFDRPKGVGSFHNYEQVVPTEFRVPPDSKPHLILDADQLLRLAKALNKKGKEQRVCLWLPISKDAAVYVKGSSDSGFGLIMPLRY